MLQHSNCLIYMTIYNQRTGKSHFITAPILHNQTQSMIFTVLNSALKCSAVLLFYVDSPHIIKHHHLKFMPSGWFTKNALKMASFHLNSFRVFSWTSPMPQLVLAAYPLHAVNTKCAS